MYVIYTKLVFTNVLFGRDQVLTRSLKLYLFDPLSSDPTDMVRPNEGRPDDPKEIGFDR